MKRLHLFEFEDQSWFPNIWREGITDYLEYAANRIDLYRPIIPNIKKGIEKSGGNRIVDICSGGGGGIMKIYQHLREESVETKIILTDKYPNLIAFRKLAGEGNGNIGYVESSVDAGAVPTELRGFRTQFVSFHHFRPEQARKILENAALSRSAIGIFEATERTFINFIAMLFTPLVVMLAVPFIRPFKWSRLFFTYIIPAIPFFTMWDGLVSVLRTYSIDELKEMTGDIPVQGYKWEFGSVRKMGSPGIIYLLGYPV